MSGGSALGELEELQAAVELVYETQPWTSVWQLAEDFTLDFANRCIGAKEGIRRHAVDTLHWWIQELQDGATVGDTSSPFHPFDPLASSRPGPFHVELYDGWHLTEEARAKLVGIVHESDE